MDSSELESRMAEITGKESALFVPSGTMGNLISCEIFCRLFRLLYSVIYFCMNEEPMNFFVKY